MSTVAESRIAETVDRYLAGTDDAPMHFVGTDFGIIANDGRFESITGFVDVGPGAPSKP